MHPSVIIGDILDQYIPEDNHVFIVGVNANEIPKQFQNNTYLDDSLRKKLDGSFTKEVELYFHK